MSRIEFGDFNPISGWKDDESSTLQFNGTSRYVIDLTTKKRYLKESPNELRKEFATMFVCGIFIHTLGAISSIFENVVRVLSFRSFFEHTHTKEESRFGNRAIHFLADIGRIATAPVAVVALQIACLYGIVFPNNGRKIYATIDRAQFGSPLFEGHFQPIPRSRRWPY